MNVFHYFINDVSIICHHINLYFMNFTLPKVDVTPFMFKSRQWVLGF